MAAYKMRRGRVLKRISVLIAFFMVMSLSFASKNVYSADFDGSVTLEGFNVDTKDWSADWTTGNLGKSYQEGELFPGRAKISNFQSLYPGFENFPDLKIWYTATYPIPGGSYGIFVDLVKGIQIGTRELGSLEGWPMANGQAYPLGTAENVNTAQNHPGQNQWNGYKLLNLPNSQINRSAVTGRIGELGTIYDDQRCFIVTAQDIKNALVAQNLDPNTVDSFYIYFELHLARTSIYSRDLQTAYASGPPAAWGGYLYSALNFNPIGFGSGPETGSSGHFGMLEVKGSRDVQLPDAPETYRTVTGKKFLDKNNNNIFDTGDEPLKDWTIKLIGKIEDILVPLETKTDANGIYTFGGLSYGSELLVYEMMQPGYTQTYPNKVESLPIGATSYKQDVAGEGSWRWSIPSMLMPDTGATIVSGVDFGNFLPAPKIEVTKTGDGLSKIGDTIKFTVSVKNTGNVPLTLVSITDDKFGKLDAGTVPNGFGPTLAVGATESHEFEMVIPDTLEDPFINKVTAIYKYMEVEAKGEATHETNLFKPSYTIEKTADKKIAVPGEKIHYTVTVKNTSSSDTPETTFVLTDELLGFVGATAKTFKLLPGQSQVFDGPEMDYTVPADALRGSTITNTASYVTSFENFPNEYRGSASVDVKVVYPMIRITKTGEALSKIGDMVTYSFEVENIGDVPLEKVKVVDDTFLFDLTSLFTKNILAVNEKETVTKSFAIPEGAKDPFINSVTATYKYVNGAFSKETSANSSYSVNLFQPSYTIEKKVDKTTAVPGDIVHYTIEVKNTSSADTPETTFVLTDLLLGFEGATAKTFKLLPGESKVFDGVEMNYTIPADAKRGSVITNTASYVTSFENFSNVYRGSASVDTTIVYPMIKITKTGEGLSKIGDMVTYSFEVENIGDVPLEKVKIYDNTFAFDLTSLFTKNILGVNEKETVTKDFTVPEGAKDPFVNSVTATYKYVNGAFSKEVSSDASHSVNLFQPSYSIEKKVDKAKAVPGETIHYTVIVKNTSSEDTPETTFVLTDELLGFKGATAKTFKLMPGQSMTFDGDEMNYVIPADAARGSVIKNEASYVTSFEKFPNVYTGSAFAETTVLHPIIKITKTGDALSKIGDMVTYYFEVENIGDVPLEKVKIYDETFAFDLTSLFQKSVLAVNEKETVSKSFTIPEGAKDPFINNVTATYKYVNGMFVKEVSGSGSHSVNLFQPGITIEKTADKTVSMVGDTINYKIIVKNTSSADAPDLVYSVVDDHAGQVVMDAAIASGATHEYFYSYIVKPEDLSPLKNTASLTASPKGFPNVLTASDSHEIKLFVPNISIEKTADTEISKVGDTINYTITVKNLTPEAFAPDMSVRVTDALLGLDQTFTLASGMTKIIKVPYVVKASDDPDYLTKLTWTVLKNTAKLTASPLGFELLSKFELEDSVSVNLVHPHIDLEKSVNTNLAHVGDTLTYTVKITNTGDVALENIVVSDTLAGILAGFSKTLQPGESSQVQYTRLLTTADIGMLENTASVLANPVGLPNEIRDKDTEIVEVRQKLYMETGWAFGGSYAIPINSLVENAKWGWTNGPLPEGNYAFPIYTGAGQNDVTKGLLAGMLYVDYHDKLVKLTYEMKDGFSLKKIHLYIGETPLPVKKTGKTSVYTADPGQFPYKSVIADQTTIFKYEVRLKSAGPIYIAAHSETYVPYWEMNAFYNTTKY